MALAVLIGLGLHFALSLPATYDITLNDFPAYRSAGRHIAEGEPELLYRTDKYFTNLPVVAVLLTPLWKLSYPDAWHLFWWLQVGSYLTGLALLLFAIARFFGPLDPARAAVACAIYLSFGPLLRRCLVLGQTTPMLVMLLVGVYLLYRGGRPLWAGSLLGFICLVKIPPMILLPLLLLRRRFDVAGAAFAVLIGGVALSALLYGGAVLQQYADTVIVDNLGRSLAAFNNRSLEGAYMRLWSDRGLVDWRPVSRPPAVTAALIGTFAMLGAALFASARAWLFEREPASDLGPRGSLEIELTLGVALMLLVFPIVWIHYYLFLAVPLVLLPFWIQRRGLGLGIAPIALFLIGGWLASGSEVSPNGVYAARQYQWLFRLSQNAQPLGAVLIVLACAMTLGKLNRPGAAAERDRESTSPSSDTSADQSER